MFEINLLSRSCWEGIQMIVFSPRQPFPVTCSLTATSWSAAVSDVSCPSLSRSKAASSRRIFSSGWGSSEVENPTSARQSFSSVVQGGRKGAAMPSLEKLTRLFGGSWKWRVRKLSAVSAAWTAPAAESGQLHRDGNNPWSYSKLIRKRGLSSNINLAF